jgi:hypothetical protein
MARETVAQRNLRYTAENEARLSREVAEYPQRLMNVLARATNESFNLTVVDNKFQVFADNDARTVWTLAYAQSPNSQEQLEDLEWTLDRYEQKQAEQKRLAEVKATALRKVNELLTAEERELLNL